MKRVAIVLMVIMSLGIFVGCGGSSEISIDDINYKISEGIIDGDRMPVFSCENNSKYDIVSLNIDYKIKDGVTEDELKSNSEISEKANKKSHAISDTTINVINDRYIEAGKKCENVPVYLDNTYSYVKNMDTINLMTPDVMTVSYLSNSKIYVAYYDFKNKKMTYEDEAKDAKTWSEKKLAKTLPEPDAKVVIIGSDEDTYFRAIACNYTKDAYKDYINECKKNGYTVDSDYDESTKFTLYSAKNKDGYILEAYYTEEGNLDVAITKP